MRWDVFRTFWYGPSLTWVARLCLASFVARGHGVELFSYGPVDGLPRGVTARDAAEILPCDRVFQYRDGAGELSGPSLHSNLFRYKMLRDIGGWWIDTDVLLLDAPIPTQVPIFAWEDSELNDRPLLGTAVLRFPAGSEIMDRAYAEAVDLVARNPGWSVTGPRLFTRLVEDMALQQHALPQSMVYAITWPEAEKFVRPADCAEVVARTRGAPFVHLYHHGLRVTGWIEDLPPQGSFLGDLVRSSGLGGAR